MRTSRLFVAALLVLAVLAAGAAAADQHEKHAKQVLIQMGHFTDDLHAAFMAIKLANALQAEGAHVTLFLNLEAVGMADKRQPQDLLWGQNKMDVASLYEKFVKGGGKVLVCPHCAGVKALESEMLRSGAKIATDAEVAKAILAADVVLDY